MQTPLLPQHQPRAIKLCGDANAGTLNFNDKTTSTGTLSLSSVAATLNVQNAPSATTTISDTKGNGNIVFASGSQTGTNAGGIVTISAGGNIDGTDATSKILGSQVMITSTSGSIGSNVAPVIASPQLVLNAASGSVSVSDSVAVTSLSGSASAAGSF